jgi:hypothetical protein
MTQTPGPNEIKAIAGDDEPLEHLYKMSPTAGVATTDYAAINGTAIVTIILGAASILVLLNPHLLFIPAAGLICGIIAVRQIRDSNGTQVGRGLAWGGMLLSLFLGGGVVAVQTIDTIHRRADEHQIAALIQQIGQRIHDEQYDTVYAQSSRRLQERIPHEDFVHDLSGFNVVAQVGRLQWLRWNEEPMYFEVNPDSGFEQASAMALEKMEKLPEPGRQLMMFVKESGKWSLSDLSGVFLQQQKPETKGPGAGRS